MELEDIRRKGKTRKEREGAGGGKKEKRGEKHLELEAFLYPGQSRLHL